jgi:hypothetical protein
MTPRTLLATLLACTTAASCSTEQTYASGQSWQQGQCNKIIDMQERERCMAPTRQPYDRYQKQADGLKKSGTTD